MDMMDGWIDDGLMDGYDGWMDGDDGWMDWMDGLDGWIVDGCWIDGLDGGLDWMDWMDGLDGWIGWMDGVCDVLKKIWALWPSKDLRLRCYHSCVVCVYTFVSSCF